MPDPISFIRAEFDGAWNARDLNRIVDCFTSDAVVHMQPPLPGGPEAYRGRDDIRGFAETLVPGFHVESQNFALEGDHVTWFSIVACDLFRELGLDALECTSTALVRDGKVASFAPSFTPSSLGRMQAAMNKKLAGRFYQEVIEAGKVDVIDELVDADFVEHEQMPGLQPGREGLKQFMTAYHAAFPDSRCVVEHMIAEGDTVAAALRFQGTHRGDFLGIPATGRSVDVPGIDLVRIRDGKAVEHWGVSDTMTMMEQLRGPGEREMPGGDGASAEAGPDNAAIVRSAYEAYNRRDFDYSIGLTAADGELVRVATGETFFGPEGMRTSLEGWVRAFPDSRIEITNIVASGNQVVVEFTARGTNTGPLTTPTGEIAPTGRPVEMQFCDVVTVRDGKIVSTRDYFDLTTMMHQLGMAEAAHA